MKITENARKVLERRYLAKDENGKPIETVEEMFERVAKTIAEVDLIYDKNADVEAVKKRFYDMMVALDFLPNSPTLMNAGRPLGQLSACFVLPVGDSMEEIFDAVKYAAIIHKSGGGTGFSFSRLRPKGATVRSTGGVASGPVSFMKVFNAATEAVKQGGTRRGANMGILRVDHPDILEFIQCKKDNNEITNFNISVAITEEFMKAVEEDREYDLIDPHTGKVVNRLRAREVFDLIVEMAWRNGEPGIVFLDRINEKNPTPEVGEIESTNPCGEQPLLPYESCNLGSINLENMLKKVEGRYVIDYDKLRETVYDAVHFLDNVIDANKYPLPQIEEMTKGTRKIGLGVMGFANMLLRLGISYDSEEAVELGEELMEFIDETSKEASIKLAEQRGTFGFYDKSIYKKMGIKIRNATTTTIAPTGTISIIAGTSSGIEPVFAIAMTRNVMDNTELVEVNPVFKEVAIERGFYSEELMREIARRGSLKDIKGIPEDVKRVFVIAHDIDPEWHVKMQAAFQKHVDNAVSKTVNFRNEATVEDVRRTYLLAYELGCKGVTIYRDGSRESQVLNLGIKEKKEETKPKEEQTKNEPLRPRPRPPVTRGITEKVRIGCGNLYITVNYDDQGICEVFTNLGRAGGCPSQSEATSRLISIALRSGIDAKTIVEQLKGIRCHSTLRQMATNKEIKVLSCPDAIGKVIEKVMKIRVEEEQQFAPIDVPIYENNHNGDEDDPKEEVALSEADLLDEEKFCPECGSPIEHEGGCVVCKNCGYSKCG
ncbi:ribonucleoside-diphosphate reductase class II [Thermoanaerobacter thermohydrosulfuricus]|uniref:Vitamin B12-dependent ribonucleotide reductase n=2 Tax=Thermoanaerobacter thermohydrosulfuricus TaxID=1516 RepID=M8CX15_THETY|nr:MULTISPECIES: vitamin B12-dependent ribonucleotide reductase [Thermoanaerobacter]EMT38908.1 ribonucleoside-diphosphate reductase, adenosylcobalamin-dependent [Thermoanaerobacter thermohydrosulfuricus WC1]SDF34776.1 ribonucleoside-diphosphate reductase class II [Thermoanaerobacter thermohydrosulfuricus]